MRPVLYTALLFGFGCAATAADPAEWTAEVAPFRIADHLYYVGSRELAAGIRTKIGKPTFRATDISDNLSREGKLEIARQMANHESARTTGLNDRRDDQVSLDEVERILI
jgi:hypothetical protein